MRTAKLLGAAIGTVLAISAIGAGTAFATYHSTIETTNWNGEQLSAFSNIVTDVGIVTCSTSTFKASNVKGTKLGAEDFRANELQLHPLYGAATGSGTCTLSGMAVSVDTGKCDFKFSPATSTEGKKEGEQPGTWHAVSSIVCSSGNIVIKDKAGLGCEVSIGSQTPKGLMMLTDKIEFGVEVEKGVFVEFLPFVQVDPETTGITYKWTAGCPNSKGKAGSNTNGTYTNGSFTLEGENPSTKAVVGVWVE